MASWLQNVEYVRAARKQSIDDVDELVFVGEDVLVNFDCHAGAIGPWLDADHVVTSCAAFVVRAEQMDQVATPATRGSESCAGRLIDGRARLAECG